MAYSRGWNGDCVVSADATKLTGMTAFSLGGKTVLNNSEELEAALRFIGETRYHSLHPFHALLHGGKRVGYGDV